MQILKAIAESFRQDSEHASRITLLILTPIIILSLLYLVISAFSSARAHGDRIAYFRQNIAPVVNAIVGEEIKYKEKTEILVTKRKSLVFAIVEEGKANEYQSVNLQDDLPAGIQATRIEDAQFLVIIIRNEVIVGYYSNDSPALQVTYKLLIYDPLSKTVVSTDTLSGPKPSSSLTVSAFGGRVKEGHNAVPPSKDALLGWFIRHFIVQESFR